MNSTFAVNRATLRALRTEFKRGNDYCQAVEAGTEAWDGLLTQVRCWVRCPVHDVHGVRCAWARALR